MESGFAVGVATRWCGRDFWAIAGVMARSATQMTMTRRIGWNKFSTQTHTAESTERGGAEQTYFPDQAMPSTPGVKSIVGWSCQARRSRTAIFPAGMQVT